MIARLTRGWTYKGNTDEKGNLVYGKAAVEAVKDGAAEIIKGDMPTETKNKAKK